MINISNPEFAEIKNPELPISDDPEVLRNHLQNMRVELCQKADFKISTHQRFLRRVLSPDSPMRNLLMVHGTGVGKTCTAIQIAEEYILRPEYQDKKVLVVSSGAVEENFRTQIFEMDRVNIDAVAGTLESKQCTGRRYLDMLLRVEKEPKNWMDPYVREKLEKTADRLINEFYEFTTYASFGSMLLSILSGSAADLAGAKGMLKERLEGRLIIIDEAHNIREGSDVKVAKELSRGLAMLAKQTVGVTLVLLTATPMFDTYKEIEYFVNLFRWNNGDQKPDESVRLDEMFTPEGTLLAGRGGEIFTEWCEKYVSYVKGENPFTFPFRLPPPTTVTTTLRKNYLNKLIGERDRMRYLPLVESRLAGIQKRVLEKERGEDSENEIYMRATIAVFPENKPFEEVFRPRGVRYEYQVPPFLTPAQLPNHAAKFVRIIEAIQQSKGVVLVYSNFVTMGAQLFAMALEEHGFTPAVGEALLTNPAYRGPTKGRYGLITAKLSLNKIEELLRTAKSSKNVNGESLRVIITSPIASEGIDFRYVRQVHILDPWWNMSRIEQVIGRGLRTCSHSALTFSEQNCTVYLHIVRHGGERECFDEYTYRARVLPKAIKIAQVRRVMAEHAMDCPIQNTINSLPEQWRELEITQIRSENNEAVTYKLESLLAPTFLETSDDAQCRFEIPPPDENHVRPLSTYIDVRDEMLSVLSTLFANKPIWDRDELQGALKNYSEESIAYTLQQAIQTGFRFKDSFGRPALLESKGDLYALTPVDTPNNVTMVDRTTKAPEKGRASLPDAEESKEEPAEVAPDILDTKRETFAFPGNARIRFSREVLNSYILDHVLTEEERKTYLRGKPEGLFTSRLYIPGTEVVVLGHENTIPADLSPRDLTAFNVWSAALLQSFIEKKDRLYGTVASNGKFAFSKVEEKEDGTVKRFAKRQKQYRPIVCGTGAHQKIDIIKSYAQTVDRNGVGIPATVVTNEKACIYAELLAREEANDSFWLTPQETSILFDNPENRKAFADTFPKK